MLLADLGAEVLRIDRKDGAAAAKLIGVDSSKDIANRSRPAIAMDLKHTDTAAAILDLVATADAFIEGFRPGVMERLGLGPDVCLAHNPRLVYGRMTGWGQSGPMANAVGHDINYIAMSGILHTIARAGERPLPPGNLVGDMGGGGLLLAFGVVCALYEARNSGRGQVVDAAMFEGAAALGNSVYAMMGMGLYNAARPGTNFGDTGAHFYEVYKTCDGLHMAVGAMEPQFYAALIKGMGLANVELPKQMDRHSWPVMKQRFAELFAARTRAEWESIFTGTDACVSPVLTPDEAAAHAHATARGSFSSDNGILQPSPVPRFSRTPGAISQSPALPGPQGDLALTAWGFDAQRIARLRASGALY
jgi:alpha-methylacyl-CoA racemase